MGERKVTYDAFISYRHSERDRYVAELLHRKLEGFRLPGNIWKKNGCQGRRKIARIFRDKDELPLTSNLADPITEALENSEFLIVICSPRIRESIWCRTEIETFIRMHGREHILAVLIEGEPEEAFPEELLYEEREEVKSDGGVVKRRVLLEPLAADVRGENTRSIRKKLKSEILRLAAPMFDCGYDDLRQRHRERRLKKIAAAALAGSAVCFFFGAVSTAMALRIDRQKAQLMEQSEKIEEQSEEIQARYIDALRTNSLITADSAMELLEEGDRMAAARKAATALPPYGEPSDIPYTPQAQFALTECLYAYENGARILPQHMLRHDTEVDFMKLSPEGKRILSCGNNNNLIVWDAAKGERLFEVPAEIYGLCTQNNTIFLTEDILLYPGESGYAVYDVETGKKKYAFDDWLQYAAASPDGKLFSVSDGNRVRILRVEDGAEQFAYAGKVGKRVAASSCFSNDGTMYAAAVCDEESDGEQNNAVFVFDTATGAILGRYSIPYRNVEKMQFAGNMLYVINNSEYFSRNTAEGNSLPGTAKGRLYAFDLDSQGKIAWYYEKPDGWLYDFVCSGAEEGEFLLAVSYECVDMIKRRDGSLTDSFRYGTEVTRLTPTGNENIFFLFTRDGVYHCLDLEQRTDYVWIGLFKGNSDNVKDFLAGDGIYALLPYGGTEITIFRKTLGSRAEKLLTMENWVEYVRVDRSLERLAVMEYGSDMDSPRKVSLYDGKTLELVKSFPVPETVFYADRMEFAGEKDEYFILGTDWNTIWYDAKTGEQVREETHDEDAVKEMFGADCSYSAVTAAGEKYFAVAEPETARLTLYDRQKKEKSVSINAAYVLAMFFDGQEERLFVTYGNNEISVYDTDDLSLIHSFTELEEEMNE